jgi:hypothetical protein
MTERTLMTARRKSLGGLDHGDPVSGRSPQHVLCTCDGVP